MNRSNIGNVVTNGVQILSVGATTAAGIARRLGHAEDALNNRRQAGGSRGELGYEEKIKEQDTTSSNIYAEGDYESPFIKFIEPDDDTYIPNDKPPKKLKQEETYIPDFAGIEDLDTDQAPEILEYIKNNKKYLEGR